MFQNKMSLLHLKQRNMKAVGNAFLIIYASLVKKGKWKVKYIKHCVMGIVLVLTVTSFGDIEITKESYRSDYLSVQESLILVFHQGHMTGKEYPFNRMDPNVKEYLRFYLEKDNSSTEAINNSIYLLGYVGDEEEVSYVDQYLRTYLSVPQSEANHTETANLAIKSGWFAGIMIKRDIEGAKGFFEKYANVSAWAFPGSADSPALNQQVKDAYSCFVSGAYAFSKAEFILPYLRQKSMDGKPYAHEADLAGLEKLTMDLYTQYMAPCAMSEEELKGNINKYLVPNKTRIELLVEKKTYQQWRQEQENQSAISRKVPQMTTESVSEAIDLTDPNQIGCLESVARQAVKAYVVISEEILAGKFNDLGTKLLDDGKVVALEKFNRGGEDLARSLRLEQAILADLRKAGLNRLSDCQIEVEVTAGLANFDAEIGSDGACSAFAGRRSEITGSETAIVTFVIAGSAEIYEKHIPAADGVTTSDTDDLKVYMKRINGQWYWNPFGW